MKRMAVLFLSSLLFLSGCSSSRTPEAGEEYLLYAEQGGTSLVPVRWSPSDPEADVETRIREALKELKHPVDPDGYGSVIPEDMEIRIRAFQKGKLDLDFDSRYTNLSGKDEILLRAAVVQSLVQIKGVSMVRFFIDGQPLREADGTETGYMREDDFVQNIGSALNSYKKEKATLYFADPQQNRLKAETVTVRYSSNTLFQKVLMEQLIKGPAAESLTATLPQDTVLLGVSVKDGICYVNFDEGFLSQSYTVPPELVIGSIVNTLTENQDVQKVQISVNGEKNIRFQDSIDLSRPLERNTDMVEETQ